MSEKDRKFWCGLLLYCVVSAEVPGSSSSPFGFPGTRCVGTEQPFS